MKKYLTYLILVLTINHADAALIGGGTLDPIANNCNSETYFKICVSTVSYSGCSTTACTECEGNGLISGDINIPNSYGIIKKTTKKYQATCPASSYGTATCNCQTTTSYSCGPDYYGTATSETSGCTACPQNATCSGGNASTFVCSKNYYQNGTTCTACPSPGLTASTGATDVTECYITTFSDTTGSGKYTSKCYYTK